MSVTAAIERTTHRLRYANRCDTGIPWFGEIPSHWQVMRLRRTLRSLRNGTWGDEPDGENDIICVRVADFDRVGLSVRLENPTLRAVPHSDRIGRVLRPGDLLLEKSGGGELQPVGAVVRFDCEQSAVCSNFVARVVVSDNCDSRFLTYLHAHLYDGRLNTRSIKQTTGIQNLDSYAYLSELVAIPPLDEQRAVAAFLGRETNRIDALIAKKERLIELLQEKRTSVISFAITRGTDADVVTRESGVPWLGPVAQHWRVERFKYRFLRIEQGWSPQCDNRLTEPGEWGVLKVGCMNTGTYDESENKALPTELEPIPHYEIRVGDLLMSRSNTAELVGSVGRVHATQGRIMLCDKLYRIQIDESRLNPEYAVHILRSRAARLQLERDATGASASMKNISNDRVANLVFAFPDLDEQRRILEYLTPRLQQLDALMSRVRDGTERLREYRSALISAAVTGKIDVRVHFESTVESSTP